MKIRAFNGKQGLFAHEKLIPPVIYGLSDFPGAAANTHYAYTNIQNFAAQGINIVTADSSLHLGWHKTLPFDPEPIISEIAAVLDANPDAKVLMRLHINPPYWWLRDNPDECVIYRTPEGDLPGIDDGEQDRLIRHDMSKHMRASIASEKWMNEAGEKLRQLLAAIKRSSAGKALAGIQLAYGVFGEWHAWGVDVSAPMKDYFKGFLKEKYKTVTALRTAWHSDVDFDSAEYCPQPFHPTDDGCFRSPSISRAVIDSEESNQRATTDAILYFASILKNTSPELLCGAFYGYYLCTEDTGVIGGHLNVKDIYSSELIDYICGPFCYMDNRKPDGVPMQRAFLESHRLRGKLWLTEMDQFPIGVEKRSGGDEKNFPVNVAILRRATLQPIFGGHGFWFYDHRLVPTLKIVQAMGDVASDVASIYRKRGWWDSPEMMAQIGEIYRFAEKFARKPYTSDADVLIIHDAEAKYYNVQKNSNAVEYALFEGIARCGVAYDCIYLSELEICEIDRYKCIIFADCPNITPDMRALIKAKTAGKTCVFLYGCGYSDGEELSVENTSATVGMQIDKTDADSIRSDCFGGEIPLSESIRPAFCVSDGNATPLAYFDNGAMAGASRDGFVFLSLPYIPKPLAEMILRDAGAHLWCDSEEPILAASGFVLINCQRPGARELTLKNGKKIEITTEGYETLVFDAESGQRVL